MRDEILDDEEEARYRLDGITLVYGRFGVGGEDFKIPYEKIGEKIDVLRANQLLLDEYQEWLLLIRTAMTMPMSAWPTLTSRFPSHKVDRICQTMALSIAWQDGRPIGTISCTGILQALIATLHIDSLNNAAYRFCACVGCTRPFKVKRQDQRYCGERCKHRQGVRDSREKGRQTATKTRNPQASGRNIK